MPCLVHGTGAENKSDPRPANSAINPRSLRAHRAIAPVGSMIAGCGCSSSIPINLTSLATPRVFNGYMPSGFRPGDFSALRRRNGYIKRVWCPPLDQPLDLIVLRDCVTFAPPDARQSSREAAGPEVAALPTLRS